LSIGRAGVGLIAIFLMLQYRKRSLYASALLLGPNMRPRITVFFTWRKVGSILGAPIAAMIYEATGSWMPVFGLVIGMDILTGLLALFALKPLRRSWIARPTA
jgi:hypothetical protein